MTLQIFPVSRGPGLRQDRQGAAEGGARNGAKRRLAVTLEDLVTDRDHNVWRRPSSGWLGRSFDPRRPFQTSVRMLGGLTGCCREVGPV